MLILILLSVSLSALAQIAMKFGMSDLRIQQALESGDGINTVYIAGTNVAVVGGLFLYGVSAVLWLLVLARIDVSKAYPFVALAFVLTMMFGYLLLGEHLSAQRILGTTLIVIGVCLVALT